VRRGLVGSGDGLVEMSPGKKLGPKLRVSLGFVTMRATGIEEAASE